MNTLFRAVLFVFASFIIWIIYQKGTGADVAIIKVIEGVPNGDKLGHFILFGVLTLLSILASRFHRLKVYNKANIYSASLVILVILTLEEFSQLFLDTRTFEWLDMSANTAGIVVFSLLALGVEKITNKDRITTINKEST